MGAVSEPVVLCLLFFVISSVQTTSTDSLTSYSISTTTGPSTTSAYNYIQSLEVSTPTLLQIESVIFGYMPSGASLISELEDAANYPSSISSTTMIQDMADANPGLLLAVDQLQFVEYSHIFISPYQSALQEAMVTDPSAIKGVV